MFRWGMLILGVASIVLGLTGYLSSPAIPVEPSRLSMAEAIEVLQDRKLTAITLDGKPDFSNKLYRSLSRRPAYTSRSPAKTYALFEHGKLEIIDLTSFLGVRVRLEQPLDSGSIAIQVTRKRTLTKDKVQSERLLAPVAETEPRIWVLSPVFYANDPARTSWRLRRSFEGIFTRVIDIEENVSSYTMDFDLAELRRIASTELNTVIDDDSFLVIEGEDQESSGLYRVPIEGSKGALFVSPFYEGQARPDWAENGPVTGVMWAWDAEPHDKRNLGRILDIAIPARYGVIHHDETAEEHNRKTTTGLKIFAGGGAVLAVMGLIGIAIKRKKKAAYK